MIDEEQSMAQLLKELSNLRAEQEQIKESFSISPIGIYILQNSRFRYSNEKFREITGYTEQELANIDPMELVAAEDREMVRKNAIAMLKGEKKQPYQYRHGNKAGELRWILESVAPIHYQGNRAVFGNFMDISESKQAESALRESEKKYRSLFDLAREGIVIVSYDDGTILDCNSEFLNQTFLTRNCLRQKKIWEIQPQHFQQEARESFFRFGEMKGGIMSWKLCQRSQGTILPVEIAAQRMVVDEREVILCMVRDVSEREAMTRALSLASEEWRKSFDAIEDSVVLISTDFRIHRANLSTGRLLGVDIRSIIGAHCYQLFHGTNAPPDYCPHLKAQAMGVFSEEEQQEPHLGRTLRFSCSPIKDDRGETPMTVEIISDVTARKQHEQESVRLNLALATSFQGITGALSDLAESRDPYTAGHSRHVADLVKAIGKEMGLSEQDLEGLRVCAILHDIGKGIIPAAILNKPGRLSEHEWGLIKSHPTTAFESLRHIPFPWPVADIVHQHHERLDGSGYPLGLRGSQIHPWAHIIAVADVLDAMTSHRPYRPRLPSEHALEELEKGRGTLYDPKIVDILCRVILNKDKRVLVVDSNPEAMEGIVANLRADGLDAIGFLEPAAALHAFAQKPYPLVLTELKMAEMDGVQLADRVKQIHPECEVIIITKYGGKEEALRALRAGAADFLEKPLDLEILKKSVTKALQRFAAKRI